MSHSKWVRGLIGADRIRQTEQQAAPGLDLDAEHVMVFARDMVTNGQGQTRRSPLLKAEGAQTPQTQEHQGPDGRWTGGAKLTAQVFALKASAMAAWPRLESSTPLVKIARLVVEELSLIKLLGDVAGQ